MGKRTSFRQRGPSALVGLLLAAGMAAAIVVPAAAAGGLTVTGFAAPSGHDSLLGTQGAIVQGLDGKEWFTTYDGTTHYGLAEIPAGGPATVLGGNLNASSTYPRMINGPGSYVWLLGDNANNLSALDSSGAQYVVSGSGADDRDLVQGLDGKLYVADNSGASIDQYTPNGTSAAGSQSFSRTPAVAPTAITSVGGVLWFTDDSGNLYSMTPGGIFGGAYDIGDFLGNFAGSLTAGPDGYLWAVVGGTVYKINPNNPSAPPTTYTSGIPSGSTLTSITAGGDGNLYFVVSNNTAASQGIGQITPSGTITILPLPSGYALPVPSAGAGYGIAAGPSNTIWATAQTSGGSPKAAVLEVSGLTTTTSSTTSTSTTTSRTTTTTTKTSTTTSTTTTHKPKPKKCKKGKVRKHGKCVAKHKPKKHKKKKK